MNPMLLRLGLVLGACAGLGACASSVQDLGGASATLAVAPDRYDATFNAARGVLRDRGFILERVDARAGVITTQPKTTAGLFTPWDLDQQSLAQEAEDLFERQQRVVRITFERPEAPGGGAATSPAPESAGERTMRVQVTIQRVHIPGRKIEPESISQTSYYYDPALGARAMQPSYAVAYKQDRPLEARLTELIAAAAALPAPAPAANTESPVPPAEPAPAVPSSEPPAPAAPPGPEPQSGSPVPAPEKPPASPWVPGQPLQKGG